MQYTFNVYHFRVLKSTHAVNPKLEWGGRPIQTHMIWEYASWQPSNPENGQRSQLKRAYVERVKLEYSLDT